MKCFHVKSVLVKLQSALFSHFGVFLDHRYHVSQIFFICAAKVLV